MQVCIGLPHEVVVEAAARRIGEVVDAQRDDEKEQADHRRIDALEGSLETLSEARPSYAR